MFGKLSLVSVILALTLAPASYLGAAQKQPQPGELPYSVQGTITHVDSKKDDVTIQTNNGEETYPVDSDTTILVNGNKATIGNLEAGQEANLRIEAEKAVRVDASNHTPVRYRLGLSLGPLISPREPSPPAAHFFSFCAEVLLRP